MKQTEIFHAHKNSPLSFLVPPSDEGGGFCPKRQNSEGEKSSFSDDKLHLYSTLSLPQSAMLTAPSSEGACRR